MWFPDGGRLAAHPLREGDTLIGRAPACDLVINAPTLSRRHARLRVAGGRVFLRDAGSTHGCTLHGSPVVGERQVVAGDTFFLGSLQVTLAQDLAEGQVLSDSHHVIDEPGTLLRRVDHPQAPAVSAITEPGATPSSGVSRATPPSSPAFGTPLSPAAGVDRRTGAERRHADTIRVGENRRSGRDRRHGRFLTLLTEISKTLVAVQPLEQVLARVVDLMFDMVPAERAFHCFCAIRWDQSLTARVCRRRDVLGAGENLAPAGRSSTSVMRERVAMLATDALYAIPGSTPRAASRR